MQSKCTSTLVISESLSLRSLSFRPLQDPFPDWLSHFPFWDALRRERFLRDNITTFVGFEYNHLSSRRLIRAQSSRALDPVSQYSNSCWAVGSAPPCADSHSPLTFSGASAVPRDASEQQSSMFHLTGGATFMSLTRVNWALILFSHKPRKK